MHRIGRLTAAVAAAAQMWILAAPLPVLAKLGGISGYSGRDGETCERCHEATEPAPRVHFAGPVSVGAGGVAAVCFVVRPRSAHHSAAALGVAAGEGLLEVGSDPGVHLKDAEITHTGARDLAAYGDANCDDRVSAADLAAMMRDWGRAGDQVCGLAETNCDDAIDQGDVAFLAEALFEPFKGAVLWKFLWRAPETGGPQEIWGSGLAVNGNYTKSGDSSATAVTTIEVETRAE